MTSNDNTDLPDLDTDVLLQLAVTAAGPIEDNPAAWQARARSSVTAILQFREDIASILEHIAENQPDKWFKGQITRCEEITVGGKDGKPEYPKGRIHFVAMSGDSPGDPETIDTNILDNPDSEAVWQTALNNVGDVVAIGKKNYDRGAKKKPRAVVAIKPIGGGSSNSSSSSNSAPNPAAASSNKQLSSMTFDSTAELATAAHTHFNYSRNDCIRVTQNLVKEQVIGEEPANRPDTEIQAIWDRVLQESAA